MNDTRSRLLDATRRCITAKGLAATTSRDITSAAGTNLAAITYHFGSKEQLVAEALLDGLRAWLAPTIEVLASDADPAVRATTAIRTLTATFTEHRDEAPAYIEALVEAPRIESLHVGVAELWGELRALLGSHIAAMCERGELDTWVDPETMAGVLVAMANGLVLQVTVDPNGPALDAMASQFAGLLLAARRAPDDVLAPAGVEDDDHRWGTPPPRPI